MQITARYQRWRARAIMQIIADSTDGGGARPPSKPSLSRLRDASLASSFHVLEPPTPTSLPPASKAVRHPPRDADDARPLQASATDLKIGKTSPRAEWAVASEAGALDARRPPGWVAHGCPKPPYREEWPQNARVAGVSLLRMRSRTTPW